MAKENLTIDELRAGNYDLKRLIKFIKNSDYKSPTFPFYVNDWISDEKIFLFSPAEEGGFLRLLCFSWSNDDCGLEDNDAELTQLSKLNGDLNKSLTKVKQRFSKIGTRLFNVKLVLIRAEMIINHNNRSVAGVRSGRVRKLKRLANEQTLNKRGTKAQPSSSSSSSYSKEHITSGKECPKKRKDFVFPKADYDKVIKEYEQLKNIKHQGDEYKPVQQAIKTMFKSGRTVADIITCMRWFGGSREEWTNNWTINTVKKKMAEFKGGSLEGREKQDDEVQKWLKGG